MAKLKPCPFCGGKAELFHSYDGYHCVQCTCCACGTIYMRTESGAVRMWNRRAGEDGRIKTMDIFIFLFLLFLMLLVQW